MRLAGKNKATEEIVHHQGGFLRETDVCGEISLLPIIFQTRWRIAMKDEEMRGREGRGVREGGRCRGLVIALAHPKLPTRPETYITQWTRLTK